MAQPALFVFNKKGESIYEWRHAPSGQNMGAAVRRVKPTDIIKVWRRALVRTRPVCLPARTTAVVHPRLSDVYPFGRLWAVKVIKGEKTVDQVEIDLQHDVLELMTKGAWSKHVG